MSEMSQASEFVQSTRTHDYPVPIPAWWVEAVKRELRRRARPGEEMLSYTELADAIGLKKYEVSKCMHGRAMTRHVAKISDYLKLPRPVVVFETEELALAWEKELRLRGLTAQVAAIAERATNGGAPPTPSDQPRRRGTRRPG
jgi:hypothetical protein